MPASAEPTQLSPSKRALVTSLSVGTSFLNLFEFFLKFKVDSDAGLTQVKVGLLAPASKAGSCCSGGRPAAFAGRVCRAVCCVPCAVCRAAFEAVELAANTFQEAPAPVSCNWGKGWECLCSAATKICQRRRRSYLVAQCFKTGTTDKIF